MLPNSVQDVKFWLTQYVMKERKTEINNFLYYYSHISSNWPKPRNAY